jgi:hypothetical protein
MCVNPIVYKTPYCFYLDCLMSWLNDVNAAFDETERSLTAGAALDPAICALRIKTHEIVRGYLVPIINSIDPKNIAFYIKRKVDKVLVCTNVPPLMHTTDYLVECLMYQLHGYFEGRVRDMEKSVDKTPAERFATFRDEMLKRITYVMAEPESRGIVMLEDYVNKASVASYQKLFPDPVNLELI